MMSHRPDPEDRGPENLLDDLAAGFPEDRLRARLESALAEEPATECPSRHPFRRWRWAAAAAAVLLSSLLLWWRIEPESPAPPAAPALLAQIEAGDPFVRLRGINRAADQEALPPAVRAALWTTLEEDPSVHLRLAALDALLRHEPPGQGERWRAAVATQPTALVQAHLADRLRRQRLLADDEIETLLNDPAVLPAVRRALTPRPRR